MIKASLGALAAVVAIVLIVPHDFSAQAARFTPPPPPPPPTTTSSTPGGGGGGMPNNPAGNGGDLPTLSPQDQIAQLEETCNGALATLVQIPERMVVAFDNEAGVSVIPICNNGLGHSAKIDASQALPLQTAIGQNAALLAALKAKGFTADDVVGVVLIKGIATLYVHKGA